MSSPNDAISQNGNTNAKTSTYPAKRPSQMLLPFLHDSNVPFSDSTQAELTSGLGRKEDMKAYLGKWSKKFTQPKK